MVCLSGFWLGVVVTVVVPLASLGVGVAVMLLADITAVRPP